MPNIEIQTFAETPGANPLVRIVFDPVIAKGIYSYADSAETLNFLSYIASHYRNDGTLPKEIRLECVLKSTVAEKRSRILSRPADVSQDNAKAKLCFDLYSELSNNHHAHIVYLGNVELEVHINSSLHCDRKDGKVLQTLRCRIASAKVNGSFVYCEIPYAEADVALVIKPTTSDAELLALIHQAME